MKLVLPIIALFILAVYAGTLWAIAKSRERTECYRAAQQVTDCEQPGAIERLFRGIAE